MCLLRPGFTCETAVSAWWSKLPEIGVIHPKRSLFEEKMSFAVDLLRTDEVVCRAWDEAMNTQPDSFTWNLMGMLNNCHYRVKVRAHHFLSTHLHIILHFLLLGTRNYNPSSIMGACTGIITKKEAVVANLEEVAGSLNAGTRCRRIHQVQTLDSLGGVDWDA